MARITKTNKDGNIREAELMTANRRKVRRPVNLLIPLEIQDSSNHQSVVESADSPSDDDPGLNSPAVHSHTYNLRPRQRIQYAENTVQTSSIRTYSPKWFLFYLMILSLCRPSLDPAMASIHLSCTSNGVLVHATGPEDFEICANHECKMQHFVKDPHIVRFSPEVTLHEYSVTLKRNSGSQLTTMETVCKGLDFCENIHCTVCASVLLNPECWPYGILAVVALSLYVVVALIYLLLYVPMTIGKPIRLVLVGACILLQGIAKIMHWCCYKICCKRCRRHQPTPNARLTAALAIVTLAAPWNIVAHSCQQINILEHHATICTIKDGVESCSMTVSEVLKLSSYKQEACLRLTWNTTLIANIKIQWKGLYVTSLIPNVPKELSRLQLTITSLSMPPTPKLNSDFISDGIDTAIWAATTKPNLRCNTWVAADKLNCTFFNDCKCAPAESKVTCDCTHSDIAEEFGNIQLKLPVKTASWELERRPNNPLTAKIPHLVSSEIFMTFHGLVDRAIIEVHNYTCGIENAPLQGCYHCAKGAIAYVRCTSSEETQGEVLCAQNAFVVPCAPNGPMSTLRFHLDDARQLIDCTVSCGGLLHHFKLSGILKFLNYNHYPSLLPLQGNTTNYREFAWPDFRHIFSIIFMWYKTLLIIMVTIAAILILGYICLNTIGLRLMRHIILLIWTITCFSMRIVFVAFRWRKNRRRNPNEPTKKSA
uniref:Phlebovirus_G2 domain-containing protein n=1 Tax=Heligmosomoides polygyrus TaxID=6339 RepID=A0A183GI98_HELPZ